MQVQALIFDFDGLIIDTETPDFDILAEQYQEHGFELHAERWVLGLGTFGGYDPYKELEQLVGQPLNIPELQQEHRRRYLERCSTQPLRPGVLALLEYARAEQIPLAVASSSSREWVEGWLEKHAIHSYFSAVRTRTDVQRVKPDPELFLAAAAALGREPGTCVVLEDSPNGMRAAARAGMHCIAIPLPLLDSLEFPAYTFRLKSLADLAPTELLERLSSYPMLESPGAPE